MIVLSIDHLVLTVKDVPATCSFYTKVLGMMETTFGDKRTALIFGNQKINLHQAGHEIVPHAALATPGSADLCFLVDSSISQVADHLAECGVAIELGPVERSGAIGPITSVYLRDPDGNLIELSCASA